MLILSYTSFDVSSYQNTLTKSEWKIDQGNVDKHELCNVQDVTCSGQLEWVLDRIYLTFLKRDR